LNSAEHYYNVVRCEVLDFRDTVFWDMMCSLIHGYQLYVYIIPETLNIFPFEPGFHLTQVINLRDGQGM
jgi:hypothetical protein